MRKCQGVAPRGPEKFASIFKNMSKVSAILLIMVVVQPYRFVAAIPDENEIQSSKIGPQGYNYGGGSPGLLHKDIGGQDLLLLLKPDVSGKHTIRGVGGKIGHESKDKSGMDKPMKEFDNEFNDASNAFDRRKMREMREMRSICASGTTRFVKVSLSGSNKLLSLAEVQVFTMIDGSETNVALSSNGASAEQSSTHGSDYDASKAIDGNTESQSEHDITQTNSESNPWWEVELEESYDVTKIVVWNRQDCCNERLSQASVSILDADRNVQATFQLPKEPEQPGEGSKGPSFTFILPQSCTLIEGTYHTRQESNSGTRPWWAFKPSTCPAGGCPLFFWIDGTGEEDFKEERQQIWLTEMFNRGYVAATVDYASSGVNFGGCHGTPINGNVGVVDKAKDMFDKDDSDSVINQLCNKSYVNCNGIAVAGFSQGSQIAALASDFDDRVSAALLYGSGNNVNQWVVNARQHCMDTIKLPKQRRRYFSGENDNPYFNRDYARGRQQLIEMSHYDDCESSERPDSCLQHEPSVTADPYTGGTIDNTGGYYIIKNGHHGQFMEWSNFTGTLVDFNKNDHLDWLDRTARITKPTLEQVQTSVTLTIDQEHRWAIGELSAHGIFFEWAANVNDMGVLGRRHVVGSAANTLDTTDFSHVPSAVIGFRLSARTHDAALIDRLDIKTNDGQIFKNLSFERNNHDAFCFSVVPERDWDQCLGGKSHLCIDFCTNGEWYSCTKSFMGSESSGPEEESEEFSKCPIPTESEHEVKLTFDLDHRWTSGEHTDSFLVHFADIDGQLGQTPEVWGNRNHVEKFFRGVSNSSPGFRVRATSNDAMFIDMLAVEAQGGVLDGLTFERNNHDGYCLGTDAGRGQYGSRCWENTIFRCIDFCADGGVIGVQDEDCMDPTSSSITCWTLLMGM